jgi:D-3-phosphoglycerate dehydrogenase
MLGRIGATYIRSKPYVATFRINIRAFSDIPDVEVENYRNEWKTYGDIENYTPGKFTIQTFNKISSKGLKLFDEDRYEIRATGEGNIGNAHAVLLRSHKLQESEIMHTVRAIARCGAGTNNIPVARCTELGIPVFNTPGANANAVKELVIAGMFLGSRRVIDGINHMKELGRQGLAKERVEKDKSKFGGREIMGKTLAVIGLGKYCLCLVILFVGSFYLFTDCKVLYHASNGSTS